MSPCLQNSKTHKPRGSHALGGKSVRSPCHPRGKQDGFLQGPAPWLSHLPVPASGRPSCPSWPTIAAPSLPLLLPPFQVLSEMIPSLSLPASVTQRLLNPKVPQHLQVAALGLLDSEHLGYTRMRQEHPLAQGCTVSKPTNLIHLAERQLPPL